MKIFKNKELLKLILSGVCLLTVILFYIFSSLLKVIFSKWIIIIGTIIISGLLIAQLLLKNNEKIKNIVSNINEYTQVLLIAVVIVQVVFTFIMFPATVLQNSMYPTLLPNDQLIIKCTKDFDNNDIIVFRYDSELQVNNSGVTDDELLIKRIIAIPGQTFNYVGDKLYINGVESEDKFGIMKMDGLSLKDVCVINGMYEECLQEDGSFKLPEGWYVVFGDNRQYSSNDIPVSIDSRSFGLVHESQIYGKVIYEVESLFKWSKIE